MALLDLLGRRWALRVIWELREEPLVFRALQACCQGVSSSVLNQRLKELRAAGVVQAGPHGYGLTEEGRRLLEAYGPLDAWAERWAARAAGRSQASSSSVTGPSPTSSTSMCAPKTPRSAPAWAQKRS